MIDYKTVIPPRFHNVSYENDVKDGAKLILNKQIQKREGLYIYGEVGTGKTHTACAMAKHILEEGFKVVFHNTGDFLEKIRDEYRKTDNQISLFRETMDFDGIIIFDDLGAEKISEWVQERLYLIINKKYEEMIPMIFTSNSDMEILSARLGDRTVSRLYEMTERIELGGGDKRIKSNEG
jgi:DNA replication protein DnaC